MTQPPLPPTINPLDYAPDAMPEFLRRRRRRLMLIAAALLALGIAYADRNNISRTAHELYWSWRCAHFSMPADTPRKVTDRREISRLGKDINYNGPTWFDGGPSASALYLRPYCWSELATRAGFQPYHFLTSGIVFLHELRTPSGKRRIVLVETISENMDSPARHLVPMIIEPPTLFSGARVIEEPTGIYSTSEPFISGRLLLGQPDPIDRSHFTVQFEITESMPKRTGIIDGYLGDDDKLTFRVRNPASTQGL